MFKDTQVMITMQLALIGIVLIAGLYLVWKALGRIEEKVDLLLLDKQTHTLFSGKPVVEKESIQQMMDPRNLTTDTLMQSIFKEDLGDAPTQDGFVIFSTPFTTVDDVQTQNELSKDVVIEDVTNPAPEPSETMTTPTLSKSKLHKMNLDKLKELCEERQLSSEGTKQQLIERLLED